MNRDYSSIYTTKDFFQKVIPLYFNKDELSLSTVGALGMFLDINGSVTEDMINIAARYINEQMPGQAELPDFIYANAANYGINNVFGTPAKMSMLLLVKEKDVITNSKQVGDHKEFTIDSDMTILVDDLYFSIPYDIKIRSTSFQGEYNHMSFYDIDYTNAIASEDVPFIKTMKTMINGDVWLVLRVNVYQYRRQKFTEPITTNSKLNIPYIDLDFSNQLCNFEAFYTPAGSTNMIQLEKRPDKDKATTKPFIYYRLTGDNSIRFSFANDDRYFLPDYNSTITIYLYETQGKSGNFPLNRNGVDISIRADTENEDIAYNRNIFPQGLSQGNSVGGMDQLTLEKVKLLTAEKQITVNSYTTDNDLNMYFNNFAAIYEHNAVFVKQRDDYAGREYGCFTRIGDGTDIFPTNTLDIRLSPDDVDEHHPSIRQYIVKPGTVFKYASESETDIVVKKTDDAEEDIEYALAPLMVITTKPNKVNYYMNTIDKDIEVDYTYFNLDSIFDFVANSCKISRDAIHGDNEYHIELELARVDGVFNDIQSEDFTLQSNNGNIDPEKLEVLIIFNTSIGDYVRMKYEKSTDSGDDRDYIYKFTATIGTTDMIDDGRLLLTKLTKREGDLEDERLVDMTNPDINFAVFYDYGDVEKASHGYKDISLVKNHMLCNVYTPRENEFYFAYPLDLIRSHVVFEDVPSSKSSFGFYIKQVPLFGKKFLLDTTDEESVLDDITSEHTFLSTVVKSLHGLFTINMKFYNTYGRARSFYIGYGTDHEIINHVNCKIHIGIKFYEGIIKEDYFDSIKSYIKSFFEDLNKLSSGTNQAYISVLEQRLHNTFPDQIKYTIFYSINDYDSKYQVIETVEDMDESSLVNFVPEYLTLKIDDINITAL